MPAATNAQALPPRVSLENGVGEGDYDLDLDPSTFEYRTSRPNTADGKQSPDSPTLGSVHPALRGAPGAEEGASRSSRSVEQMATPGAETATATNPLVSTPPRPVSSAPQQNLDHAVNPATIPIRTSSYNAVSSSNGNNGGAGGADRYSSSPKGPKKHRSLGSVPEEKRVAQQQQHAQPQTEERDWVGQTQQQQHPRHHQPNSGAQYMRSRTLRTLESRESRASTNFSQQPTLNNAFSIPPPSSTLHPVASSSSDPISASPSSWTAEKENILRGPFDYLESHPGKDIRSQLITAFNAWLNVPTPSLRIITRVVGMLHTASLLIDDVEDSSSLRRGVPVAHQIFGAPQTINSANYVYFCALQELLKLDNPECITIYSDELVNLHRGQGMDLFWRDTLTCPSEDDYLEMVGNKTGGLFRLAIKLMCAESPSHTFNPSHHLSASEAAAQRTDYIPLVNTIGLLFQILDDYRNLSDTTYTANKGLCEDLTEGKFSFPIIHAIRADPANLVLINILKQKTQDDDVKRYAVSYMERQGSFAYTRRVLRGLTKKALSLVDELDAGQGKGDGVRLILERMKVDRHARGSQSV